jgi:hypothetical protein
MVSMTQSFQPHYGPGVDSASNMNEYKEYFQGGKGGRCVGLTTLPPSCADCLEIWEPQSPGTLRACPSLWWDWFMRSEHVHKKLVRLLGWAITPTKYNQMISQYDRSIFKNCRFTSLIQFIGRTLSLHTATQQTDSSKSFVCPTNAHKLLQNC